MSRVCVLRVLPLLFLLSAGVAQGAIYAVDEGTPNLYTINPATGAPTLVATAAGEVPSISGLGWDSAAGRMYISDLCSSNCGLGTINLVTGALTYIGSHAITSNIHGLAYDSAAGILYGVNTEGQETLAIINRATGAASTVGEFGTDIVELAYVPATNTLYGISPSALYTINKTTGQATLVGPFGATSVMRTVTWDASTGTMYAANGEYGDLYTVNRATGAATHIADSGVQLNSIEAVVVEAPTPVPTTSGYGLMALALLTACAAVFFRLRA